MKVAVASGKGGTGKTTLATNLAAVIARSGATTAYLDCDVEEPNGHLFLKPEIVCERVVGKQVPRVDPAKCGHCGACAGICQFSAIVCLGNQTLVYDELCHSCGGCALVCPVGAITEQVHPMGVVNTGAAGAVQFVSGTLNVGEPASPPVIRAVKQAAPPAEWTFVDAPPGTSCPVIESVRGSDYVLLVTEPTPFGLNDLKLAVEMTRALRLPFGVVVNRADGLDNEVRDYCQSNGISVLARIPENRCLAEAYSRGVLACDAVDGFADLMESLQARLEKEGRLA